MRTEHRPRSPHPGTTTGTSERPPTQMTAPVLAFDLAHELAHLHNEHAWRDGDRNAKALVKETDFRIVLVALRAGARMEQHRTAGRISVQVLTGHVRLHMHGEIADLPAGHIVAIERDVSHDVEARDDSAFLLTIAWRGTHNDTADKRPPS